MNKLAITLVIGYYMHSKSTMGQVQLNIHEVDGLPFSNFKCEIMILDDRLTYWSKATQICKGSSWMFRAYRLPLNSNDN